MLSKQIFRADTAKPWLISENGLAPPPQALENAPGLWTGQVALDCLHQQCRSNLLGVSLFFLRARWRTHLLSPHSMMQEERSLQPSGKHEAPPPLQHGRSCASERSPRRQATAVKSSGVSRSISSGLYLRALDEPLPRRPGKGAGPISRRKSPARARSVEQRLKKPELKLQQSVGFVPRWGSNAS